MHQKAGDIPIMLIGTNIDLAEDRREVPREHGIEIAEKNNMSSFAEVSVKTGQNVNKAFEVLTEIVLERVRGRGSIWRVRREDVIIPPYKGDIDNVKTSLINPVLKINNHLSLRLENGKINIYVGGRLFKQFVLDNKNKILLQILLFFFLFFTIISTVKLISALMRKITIDIPIRIMSIERHILPLIILFSPLSLIHTIISIIMFSRMVFSLD